MAFSGYVFEAKQIQTFIFASGKLRDVSGASEIIESISSEDETGAPVGLAKHLLDKFCSQEDQTWLRASGGAVEVVVNDEAALCAFRSAFRLAVVRRAPGLSFADGIGTAETAAEALDKARKALLCSGPVPLLQSPPASPLVRPAPRTGGAPSVVTGWTSSGRCTITGEYADLPTLAKRQFLRKHGNSSQGLLVRKFVESGDASGQMSWPDSFASDRTEAEISGKKDFPFKEGTVPRIAILHADGTGMGALFREARKHVAAEPELVKRLSTRIAVATRSAARSAMMDVVKAMSDAVGEAARGVVPARPVLLGGDDLTIILRADLAVGFARQFRAKFEDLVTKAVRETHKALKSWPTIRTKIGIVFIAPGQPFARAYELCESLVSEARATDASRIAFYRVTTAAIPVSAGELHESGRTKNGVFLWKSGFDVAGKTDELAGLVALAEILARPEIGAGPFRQVAELLRTDPAEAKSVYSRALSVLEQRDKSAGTKHREELIGALHAAGMPPDLSRLNPESPVWCPLLQAHDLALVMKGA
jgi:hypothetical protein